MINIEEIIENLLAEKPSLLDLNDFWHECPPEEMSDEQIEELIRIIATNESIRAIKLADLHRLKSSSNEEREKKLARLFDAISKNSKIKELIFDKQSWIDERTSDEAFGLYLGAIANPNLKRFGMVKCCFDSNIREDRLTTVFKVISENQNIKHLNLADNTLDPIHDDPELGNHLSIFVAFIKRTQNIQTLILSNTGLGEDGFLYEFRFAGITDAIAENKSIRTLDLSDNNIGQLNDVNFNRLVNAIRQNENILFARIKNRHFIGPLYDEGFPSQERLNLVKRILRDRPSPITYSTRVAARTLKNIRIKSIEKYERLPGDIIGNVLTFLHKHKKLQNHVMSCEFPKLLSKSPEGRTLPEADSGILKCNNESLETKTKKEEQESNALSIFEAYEFYSKILYLCLQSSYDKLLETAITLLTPVFPEWIQKRIIYGDTANCIMIAKSALGRLIPNSSTTRDIRNMSDNHPRAWISAERDFLLKLAQSTPGVQKLFFDELVEEVSKRIKYNDANRLKM